MSGIGTQYRKSAISTLDPARMRLNKRYAEIVPDPDAMKGDCTFGTQHEHCIPYTLNDLKAGRCYSC